MSEAGSTEPAPNESRAKVYGEIAALWLITLLIIRLAKWLVDAAAFPSLVLAVTPILFMYAPVLVCRLREVDSWSYPLALPAFRDREAWWRAVKMCGIAVAVVMVPWLIGYHIYQTEIFPSVLEWLGYTRPEVRYRGTWPQDMWMLVGYHLFFVAIPEEMFYRGYIQTRLDEVLPKKWRIFGANLGWGWLATCVIFAFGHSIVSPQWWHFAIFFPSLAFGWMRERTGGVVAGALFHAWANVQVTVLDTLYGIRSVDPFAG